MWFLYSARPPLMNEVPGLVLDFDPALLVPGAVNTLIDGSGAGNDFDCTGHAPDAEAATGPNGAPAVYFGAGKYGSLGASPFAGLTEAEFLAVWKFDNPSTADGTTNVPWQFSGSASNPIWKFAVGPDLYEGAGSTVRAARGNPTQVMTSYHLGRVISTASEYTIHVGTQQLYTTGVNTVALSATCVIGSGTVASGTSMLGRIARLCLFDHKLTTNQLAMAKAALRSRFGVVPGL